MTNIIKRFRIVDRKGVPILETLREFLLKKLHLYRETTIFQKTGGRSGDLGEETMEYEIYRFGSENGWTDGSVHLYAVLDHTTNGYGLMMSVLVMLPEQSEERLKLLAHLDQTEFVSSHSSFRKRPFGHHSFRAYLDDVPSDLGLTKAFAASAGRVVSPIA